MAIKKAVFPAAGLGTRFLPVTKAIPKEMLCLVDKPLIQYGVEEAIASGLKEIIIITGQGKNAIEDHFDFSQEFERLVESKRMLKALAAVRQISNGTHFCYTRQKEPKGLGHALLCARNLVNNEPFALLLGDEVILSRQPVMAQLMEVFIKYGSSVLALQRVRKEELPNYGVVSAEVLGEGVHRITHLVEKPRPGQAPSNLAIVGRYILSPGIFEALAVTRPGKNREVQLTDALTTLTAQEPVFGLEITGQRYDSGTVLGWLKANMALALTRPDLKNELERYLRQLIKDSV